MERMMKKLVCFVCAFCLCLATAVPTWADDGNPLAGATSIGTSGTVKGTINQDNENDYYKYVVSGNSSVELKVTFTSHIYRVNLKIFDAGGNETASSYIYANDDTNQITEKYTYYLNPGTYYIGVCRAYDDGNYSLSFNTAALNNTDVTFDDTVASAHSIPLNTKVSGIVSEASNDEIDIYKLDVTKPGMMKYNFKFYMRTIYFKLLDAEGNEIEDWYCEWNDNLRMGTESIEFPLETGTYYIEILRTYYDGKYSFDQAYKDIGSTEKEPNNTLEQAQPLKLGEKVTGMIAIGDDTDFYKISVPTKRNITFTVPSKIKNSKIYIYNADGEEVNRAYTDWNDNTKKGTLKEIYKLPAGIYYVQMVSDYYNGTYTLTASTTKAPTQGKITTIKRTKKDWFGNRSIYLKLGKSSYAEGYQIYVARNSKLKGASKYVSEGRTFTVGPLGKGAYYVKVRGYSKNSDGEYIYGKFSKVRSIRL